MKKLIKNWLRIEELEERIDTLERLILNQEAKLYGFAVLKRHLNRPDKPLPKMHGKNIKQD